MIEVKGKVIDNETRCEHYHSLLDVAAIKFKCCNQYYPCFECHEETAGHKTIIWNKNERNAKAILCGVCKKELTIKQYFNCDHECPYCKAKFNPNCSRHYHLYFEV